MAWSIRAKVTLSLAAAIVAGGFAACGTSSSGGNGPGGADAADEPDVSAADGDTDAQGDDAASLDDLPSLSDVPPFPIGPDGCYLAFGPCQVSTNCCSGNCTDAGCNPSPRPP